MEGLLERVREGACMCVKRVPCCSVFEPTPTLTGHMVCVMPAVSFACVLTTPKIHQLGEKAREKERRGGYTKKGLQTLEELIDEERQRCLHS